LAPPGVAGCKVPFAAPLAAEAVLPHEAVDNGKPQSTRGATVRRRARAFVLKAEVVKRRRVQKSHLRLRLRKADGA
jgi:hypothetical protein